MAAHVTSPTLEALVERLLRPLALATDDALRRLELAIAPDDDVRAGPDVAAAAPIDGSAGASTAVATQRHARPGAPPGRETSQPSTSAAHQPAQPAQTPPASAAPQRLPAPAAGTAAPAAATNLPPSPAQATPSLQTRGAPVMAASRVRASAATPAERAPAPPAASGEFPTPGRAPLTAFAATVPPAGAAPSAPVHQPPATSAPPVAAPRSTPLAAVRTAPLGASPASHEPAAAGSALPIAAAQVVTPPTIDVTASRSVTVDHAAAPDLRSEASAAAPFPTTTRPDAAKPEAVHARWPQAHGLGLRVAPRVRATPGVVPHPTASRRTPALASAMPEPPEAAPATAAVAPETMATAPRSLRLVASRLDRAMAPVFNRALDASPVRQGDDDLPDDATPRISNTFNVHVALGGAPGALNPRQIEEALGDWLRASARRQGLMP